MNELVIENGQLGLSEAEGVTLGSEVQFEAPEGTDVFGARASVPEKLSEMPTSDEFEAAAARARRERHLSAVLNAGLYGRGNKEIDALVDEFADAKGLMPTGGIRRRRIRICGLGVRWREISTMGMCGVR